MSNETVNVDAKTTYSAKVEQRLRDDAMEQNRLAFAQQREDAGYADLGFVYAGSTPVANSVGGEVGFVSRDPKTNETSRTGFGFYIRSDHLCQLPFVGRVTIPGWND